MKKQIASLIRKLDGSKVIGKYFLSFRLCLANILIPISSPPIEAIYSDALEDVFFGYYDECPENSTNSLIIMNRGNECIGQVLLYDRVGALKRVFEDAALSSQLGSRCLWHSEHVFSYNTLKSGKLGHVLVDTKNDREVTRNYPIYTVFKREDACMELAIDFALLHSYRSGYGYKGDVPNWLKGNVVILNGDSDIIYSVPMNNGIHYNHFVYISNLDRLLALEVRSEFLNDVEETVNNTLVEFDWVLGEFRSIDPFKHLSISHFCYYDGSSIIGTYFNNNSWNWAYFDLVNLKHTNIKTIGPSDGHPTVCKKDGEILLAYDSYPDLLLQRQKLIIGKEHYSIKYSQNYKGQDRNDLHPRFGGNGAYLWVDSVENEKRELWRIGL